MDNNKNEAFRKLTEFIKDKGPSAVALSGGVDSSLVALAAYKAHGGKAVSFTVSSELTPPGEAEEAARVAGIIGIRNETIHTKLLELAGVVHNPTDRCYHCKNAVFDVITKRAGAEGIGVVMDGTNADDKSSYRPGLRSLKEKGVISPLAELGIGKSVVRETARVMGLPNWDTPSRPCLATRFPYGNRLEPGRIERVGIAEEFLISLGFREFRVRDHGGLARLELDPEGMDMIFSEEITKKVVAKLTTLGYNYVTVDLEGFRGGSMDSGLNP